MPVHQKALIIYCLKNGDKSFDTDVQKLVWRENVKSLFGEKEKWTKNRIICDLDLKVAGMAEDGANENYGPISTIILNTD